MPHREAADAARLLATKPCGQTICPNQMKDLWAKARLALGRWDEFMEHPTDVHLRVTVGEHMEQLRAAAKLAEPVMEVRLVDIPILRAAA